MAAKGLFDYLNAINKKSLPKDEDKSTFVKGFSPFIINRFMSCEPSFVFLANAMNMNYGYTPEMVFDFYYLGVPKNNKFIKYNVLISLPHSHNIILSPQINLKLFI